MHHQNPDERLVRRILSELREMPGLRVTAAQAERLWALDTTTCEVLLTRLVEERVLQRTADGRAFAAVSNH